MSEPNAEKLKRIFVSMKSGLEGRNNPGSDTNELLAIIVSQ